MLLLEENSTQKCSIDTHFISTVRKTWSPFAMSHVVVDPCTAKVCWCSQLKTSVFHYSCQMF